MKGLEMLTLPKVENEICDVLGFETFNFAEHFFVQFQGHKIHGHLKHLKMFNTGFNSLKSVFLRPLQTGPGADGIIFPVEN